MNSRQPCSRKDIFAIGLEASNKPDSKICYTTTTSTAYNVFGIAQFENNRHRLDSNGWDKKKQSSSIFNSGGGAKQQSRFAR